MLQLQFDKGKDRDREKEGDGPTKAQQVASCASTTHVRIAGGPQIVDNALAKEIALVLIWFMFGKDFQRLFLQTHNPKLG